LHIQLSQLNHRWFGHLNLQWHPLHLCHLPFQQKQNQEDHERPKQKQLFHISQKHLERLRFLHQVQDLQYKFSRVLGSSVKKEGIKK